MATSFPTPNWQPRVLSYMQKCREKVTLYDNPSSGVNSKRLSGSHLKTTVSTDSPDVTSLPVVPEYIFLLAVCTGTTVSWLPKKRQLSSNGVRIAIVIHIRGKASSGMPTPMLASMTCLRGSM